MDIQLSSALRPPMLTTAMRFGAVGLAGVGVNESLLYLLHMRLGTSVIAAAVVATEAAILANYLGNELWTFASRPDTGRLLRFQLTALAGLAITVSTLQALMALTGMHLLVANLAAVGAGAAWNFVVNVTWTWRRAA